MMGSKMPGSAAAKSTWLYGPLILCAIVLFTLNIKPEDAADEVKDALDDAKDAAEEAAEDIKDAFN